jgi:hypothetical protein
MEEVESRAGVPRVLDHEARQGFRPAVQARLTRPAPDSMLVQRLDHSGARELQRPVALAEVPFILTGVAKSLPYEIAGTASHEDSGYGLRGRLEELEALLI